MLQAPNFGIQDKKTANINVKNKFIKTVIGDVVAHLTPQKNHPFVIFVVYYFITTCAVECYWHCSDETVHYKSDETVNFCVFRCATTSPITVFINLVFYIYMWYVPD